MFYHLDDDDGDDDDDDHHIDDVDDCFHHLDLLELCVTRTKTSEDKGKSGEEQILNGERFEKSGKFAKKITIPTPPPGMITVISHTLLL